MMKMRLINIIDYIQRTGRKLYWEPEVIGGENYGIPQRRIRLITVLSKSELAKNIIRKKEHFSLI